MSQPSPVVMASALQAEDRGFDSLGGSQGKLANPPAWRLIKPKPPPRLQIGSDAALHAAPSGHGTPRRPPTVVHHTWGVPAVPSTQHPRGICAGEVHGAPNSHATTGCKIRAGQASQNPI
eukprot:GGOE01001343.1.p3 GENE.GGOE01001343.1~~GGOE01001343.1.p3  ORF type:complete len:120 (-),score=4.96 GGOE01001343.1:27-386(-)